jgi:cyclic-di-GMP-binding protein
LGTTAWASVTRSGQLRIGVRFLPGTVLAVELRAGDADLTVSGNPVPAFLLQAVPALNIPPSLIMPRDWFRAGRVIEIKHHNGEIRDARLGFSVERGIDYERVSYTLV